MKKVFTTLLIICSVTLCKAQWVTIPDVNFRNWLYGHGYSTCLSGNQLDTTCSLVITALQIDCSIYNINDLSGIQYFDNLQSLDCSSNYLITLPTLPSSLTSLICSNDQLTALPTLPPLLYGLDCSQNQITSLPALPSSLYLLKCGYNQLTSMPSLPSGLFGLYCESNLLTSLPTLPSSIEHIGCAANQLDSLPTLPSSLVGLNCGANPIVSLPNLPLSLLELACDQIQMSFLPVLPPLLIGLNCPYNFLTSLPVLPNSLRGLYCWNNQLTSLPVLPDTLIALLIQNNPQLMCLPIFHYFTGGPTDINISGTGIACFPITIQHPWMVPLIDAMPICDSLNSNGCNYCQPDSVFQSVEICYGGVVSFYGQQIWNQGNYHHVIYGIDGCDSIVATLHVTEMNQIYNVLYESICSGDFFYYDGQQVSTAGTHTFIFTAANGCDSTVFILLDVFDTMATYISENLCSGEVYNFNGINLNTSGTYVDTLSAVNSCDSIVHLNLHIIQAELQLSNNALSINTSGTVQWYNCNSHQIISGATQNIFIPTVTGNYAAIITEGNCTDTSDCVSVSINSINSINNNDLQFSLFPNPTNETVTVQFSQQVNCKLEITNTLGQIVYAKAINHKSSAGLGEETLNLQSLPSGLYFCSVKTEDGKTAQQKLMVQH